MNIEEAKEKCESLCIVFKNTGEYVHEHTIGRKNIEAISTLLAEAEKSEAVKQIIKTELKAIEYMSKKELVTIEEKIEYETEKEWLEYILKTLEE